MRLTVIPVAAMLQTSAALLLERTAVQTALVPLLLLLLLLLLPVLTKGIVAQHD
jgi:hypothetical protein